MVGITQNRSIQDEKLIEAVFQSHFNPESKASSGPIYGATSTNLIIDARPTTNAMANTAKGAGTENMDHYKEGKKVYLGIDHIHTMRESLGKVVDALREADTLLASINNDLPGQVTNLSVLDRQALRRSGWLRHISAILEGTVLIARNVHINSSHVLIHCSDGWDRTSQLSALAQLCLDPYYRTITGFEVLIEKDWLSFGHKFMDRCGHLSSDKFFISSSETANSGGADAAQAFLASVQNRFVSQQHIKETSPVFHQFLESVRQIQRQFPERFEFNERFLHQLYYHLYSCQFGTFLFNSERERKVGDGGPPPIERTISVWDYFNSPGEMQQNLNPEYKPSLDDPTSRLPQADMGVLYPNPKDVRFWHELYDRTDEEMNGRAFSGPTQITVEGPQAVIVPQMGTPVSVSPLPSPSKSPVPPSSPLPRSSSLSAGSSRPNANASTGPRDISASTPTLSPTPELKRPAAPPREDSFRHMSSSPSVFSLQPTASPSQPSVTPSRAGIKAPEFFANTSVKSVWGKLSSNASAALSVVQEAYEGVSRGGNATEAGTSGGTKELMGRDTLSAWGDDQRRVLPLSASSSAIPASANHNPWSVKTSTSPLSLSPLDNPWGSVRGSPRKESLPLSAETFQTIEAFKPLPPDPAVSSVPRPSYPLPALSRTSEVGAPARSQSSTPLPPPPSTANSTDPLGVGLI